MVLMEALHGVSLCPTWSLEVLMLINEDLGWICSKAGPETRIWEQLAYLGAGSSKQEHENRVWGVGSVDQVFGAQA